MMKNLILGALALLVVQTLGQAQYTLTVESAPAVGAGGTVYRFYVEMQDATDRMSAVFGNDQASLLINTPAGAFNSAFNSSWNASGINPAFLGVFPDLADDTYATIGLEGPASTSGIVGAADPSIVEDATQAITPYFLTDGATNLTSTTLTGASWYVLNTAANGLPDGDLRVLIMQVTTAGDISGQINFQVFPLGVGADQQQLSIEFDGTGTFGADEPIEGCTDDTACNYNAEANTDDDSCVFVGAGECDCDGNVVDACGICGGDNSSCTGCTSQPACNYDASALVNDPTQCEFAQALCSECAGNADDGTGFVVVNDQDGDGICDDVDTCVGTIDTCGVCAGPGAVYDCGCSDIPAGECDCDGNVLDECGVCGGNGIAAGDCDCDGNQLDALGECGGPCEADANGNGICDDAEIPGCMAENACNFDAAATEDDGSCDFCSCAPEARPNVDYPLIVEASPAVGAGGTVYRFYVQMQDATDRMSAVFGNDQASLLIDTPAGAFNSSFNSSWNASGINPAFLGVFPDLADDTYATIGLSGPASTSGIVGAADPSIVEDATQAITPYFLTPGATNLTSTTLTGSSWYVLNTAANGLPDADLRVLILQVTTAGDISGQINYQVFPLGVGADQQQISLEFDGLGTFGDDPETNACGCTDENADNYDADAEYDDGSCVTAGCTDSAACNYNADADTDDGSCADLDCDGVCGGSAVLDDCGICNGPGAIYECGCSDIPAGDCDCDGNVLDECEVCGGNGIPAGDCDCDGNQLDALGECGGPCEADADADGICDDVDNCTDLTACNYNEGNAVCAYLDECEVCGGDGIAEGECDCDGNVDDALGVCGGDCASDVNDNGICDTDDIPGCTVAEACNYDPNATLNNGSCDFLSCLVFGCTDPSACNYDMDADFSDGSCTYASFPYDCNNECVNDADGDGVCDELEIPGCTDASACNYSDLATDDGGNCVYPEPLYNCDGLCVNDADGDGICDELENPGCTDLSACNFEALATDDDGSCLYIDALGACGGPCEADADADGICDDVDPCVGELDACGVCNGPGEIYECGCADIPEGDCDCDGNVLDECDVCGGDGIPAGDCDCDGNQLDALGECGGPCVADADADGICDDVDPCVGELDACGVCNGPGEIYECGCADIPEGDCDCDGNVLDECDVCGGDGIPAGDCDCDGNQLDALGECGGPCVADADADGICDDVDPCVGELDACGVCNGPGEIYECGCADIPEGDCDCNGNQLDALGNCGGGCEADENNDGVCDTEIQGCTSELACNYNPSATFDDGSCAANDECGICGGDGIPAGDCDCDGNQLDALGECGGPCAADADADGICDDVDPCVGALDACGVCNGPGATYECGCSDIPEGDCDCDGNVLDECGICGGVGIPDGDCDCDGNVLDECGICGGDGIPAGDCDCNGNQLDALGECGGSCEADADADGICDDVDPCVGDLDACGVCNGPGAIYDCGCTDIPEGDCDCDGNVLDECGICGGDGIPAGDCDCDGNVLDECGICGGDGIPAGDCDCNGNQLDALGECGGPCEADADADGICDDVDPCVGELDACGVCNGPGAIYDCGCTGIPAGDCDCNGNQLDECFVCGGGSSAGCTDPAACNYDSEAGCDNASCTYIADGDCDCEGNQLDALGECGGPCEADADMDGICDDVDDCVGQLDECGVCNGPGAIYDCGCSDIPVGDCDCDGNQLDALGECGGPCEADADMDGICDDVDPCVGDLDSCGICNGPGAIYDCGCADIPEGDCDCNGNELDALGECGGTCVADANNNGICDDAEIPGCTDSAACNYNSSATEDDGSCDFCSCGNGESGEGEETGVAYPLIIESSAAAGDGGTVYRFYVQMQDATDRMSAVFGNDQASFVIDTPEGVFNSTFNSSWNASGINPAFLSVFPDLADDTYATIGLEGPASTSGIVGAADPSLVEDANQAITPYFLTPGATLLESTTLTGASWYILNTAANGLPDANGRVLILQVTTAGSISGQINYQVFPLGVGIDQEQISVEFDGAGTFGTGGVTGNACGCTDSTASNYDGSADYDDGSCEYVVLGCTDENACNYNGDANTDDGSCAVLDCDGVCGGTAVIDDCGICNGPGAIYECGCADIPDGDCDCNGNQLDALGECGGSCETDADADGICDDVDPCVGELDACGICNGPGAIYDCGCSDIPAGDCDCNGNQLDALGVCGGPCEADADADGICDDVDECIGELDACGVCNGPGEIYECGCSDIPEGDCDCNGNQEDVIGECGGTCELDNNANGICDDEELTVWDVISSNDSLLNTLDAAILAAGLDSALSVLDTTTAFTVFAPTDTAFAVLLAELGLGAEDLLADTTGLLVNTLLYHVLGEVVLSTDMMDGDSYITLQGDSVLVSVTTDSTGTTIMINDATVIVADVLAANGVVHIIDVVLEQPVFGCMDEMACNYDADATNDDGSCTYPDEDYLDCDGNCLNDADGDGVCDELEVAGCTNLDACNYDELATDDDGSCILIGDTCDDEDDNTINDTIDENCDCVGEVEDGVEEARLAFGMFPNPTTGEVTLTVAGFHTGVTVQILDGAGRVVWAKQNVALQGNTLLDLSGLSSGTYNVMLSDERGVSVKRLAIQR